MKDYDLKCVEQSLIYFLQPVGGGLIKIGCSKYPAERLVAYARLSPIKLELITSAPGIRMCEFVLHQRFDANRSHFEWFRPEPDLIDFVWSVVAAGQLPADVHEIAAAAAARRIRGCKIELAQSSRRLERLRKSRRSARQLKRQSALHESTN